MKVFLAGLLALASPILGQVAGAENAFHRRTLNGTLAGLSGQTGVNQTFDYVVIGAGTAGLVMATRLAQQYKVAVIEAGTYYELTNPLLSSTPAGDVVFVGSSIVDSNPAVDWEFVTTPQAGAANRTIHYCRGRTLGGSSARNFMIYQRGTIGAYQEWADNVGDQSFTFENFLPYFQKSCNFTPPNTAKRAPNATAAYNPSAFSPAGGPLHVSYANYGQSFSSYLPGSFYEIGIKPTQDFNSGRLFGSQYCSSTIDPTSEVRSSSEESFLEASANNPNLKVFDLTMAKQILFDSNKTATGVLVSTAGVPYILSASKEVIVSAGAFHSPQMLMVSGIGPAATLTANGIPVLVNNPNVGQNMWDHVFAGPSYRVNLQTFTMLANDPAYVAEQFAGPYSVNQSGPLTNPVSDFLAWEKVPSNMLAGFTPQARSDLARFPSDWPDIEYISGAGYVGDFADLIATQPKDGYQYATILATIVAPLSRGNVTIVSPDTDVLPVVNPNWLTSPTDQQVAVAAYKRVRQAFASPFMQQVVIGQEYYPGPQVQTDAQILAQYQNDLLTVWHASCTCKMGNSTDPMAVIDTHARVYGVKSLRVVDASSFPLLPPGHPQSTIYALAEKVAAQILAGQ